MIGRPPTCDCGSCQKCSKRKLWREWYQSKTMEERRQIISKRDPEKVRAAEANRYQRDKEKRSALNRSWALAHPEETRSMNRDWAKRNPEKRRAHAIVLNEKRTGRMVPSPCEVCGSAKVHAHHDDYSKPLDVRWLCPTHHGETYRKRGKRQ